MKNQILLIMLLLISFAGSAQWNTSGSNISYNAGNVGIGTTSPAALLHINATDPRQTFRAYAYGNTTNYLNIWQGSGAAAIDPIGTGLLYLGYDQTTNVTINGNLGIGNTSPAFKLDIDGFGARVKNSATASNAYTTFRVQGPDYTNGLEIDFYGNNNITSDLNWSYGGGVGSAAIINVNPKPLVLGTNNAGRMLIDGNGNVGIGTATPSGLLELKSSNPEFFLTSSGASPWAAIRGNGGKWIFGYGGVEGSEDISMGTQDGSGSRTLSFAAGGTARMRISANGNVGIGTITPAYKLDVNGPINVSALNINGQPFVGTQWATTGTTISYTGKVGIGTPLTSNPNNYTLAVNGTIGGRDVHIEKSSTTWPDYVFEKSYDLPSLNSVENYIQEHKHLEDVPSAKEVNENGYSLNEMDVILLKKVEELSLYIIQQQKEIQDQQKQIDALKKKVEEKE